MKVQNENFSERLSPSNHKEHSSVLTVLTSILIFVFPLLRTLNSKLIFPSLKNNQILITENIFPREWQLETSES